MTVSIKAPGQMPQGVQRLYERALAAINQRNYRYASDILRNILLAEPGFIEARLTLRQAQLERVNFTISIVRQSMAMLTTLWPIYVSGPMALKKQDFAKALDIAEKAMEADPTLTSTLNFLARSAEAAGLKSIAVNSMEIAVRFHPNNRTVLKNTAAVYKRAGEIGKYVQMLQKLNTLMPNNLHIENELKHAAALAAMKEARWEEADSFRDLIRDKDLAETLEQQERISVHDEEGRERLIKSLKASILEKPAPGTYKRLAALYHQNGQFDEAIATYRKLNEVTGNVDPAIENTITDVLRDKFEQQINSLREQLAATPDEQTQLRIAALEKERDQVILDRYKKRVENYPNDLQFRFELGLMLWKCGFIDEAMREFQLAQRSPHLQPRARLYMGKCLTVKKMYDLAVEQFTAALADPDKIPAADRTDALYDLGVLYEQKNEPSNALKYMKELFAIDVNYRDVSERLERYYVAEREAQEK